MEHLTTYTHRNITSILFSINGVASDCMQLINKVYRPISVTVFQLKQTLSDNWHTKQQ